MLFSGPEVSQHQKDQETEIAHDANKTEDEARTAGPSVHRGESPKLLGSVMAGG